MKVNIRINLLPPEFRSAGVDPKLKLILGASGLAAAGLLLLTWLYLVFSTSSLGDELQDRQQDIFAYKKEAVQVDTLLDEINDYKERERAIISIKTNRMSPRGGQGSGSRSKLQDTRRRLSENSGKQRKSSLPDHSHRAN